MATFDLRVVCGSFQAYCKRLSRNAVLFSFLKESRTAIGRIYCSEVEVLETVDLPEFELTIKGNARFDVDKHKATVTLVTRVSAQPWISERDGIV